MQDHATFYVTGGTIPPDAPSYVERAADNELLAALRRGELCYVLNARQMGKSSLSVRTRQTLEAAGTRTAFLDLQKFGSSATAEQWYRALLERIGSDLKVRALLLTYWRDNAELPPLSRLFGALRDVALEQIPGNLVIFLDEIDVVRDLGFKTDEFFGAIRESHNARAEDAALTRLTFCIIGTVAPTDLIRDVRLSPFNIGTRVRLADLTAREAAPLAGPLPGGAKTLDRVLWWTSGHPYLTQRLCAGLTNSGSTDVDAIVARLFFSKSDADVDENIKNVRNAMLRMGGEGAGFDRTDLLTRYCAIVAGKRVPDDDTDGVCTALRLSGLVTSVEGNLRVRNHVYARLFDAAWIAANLPDAEVRRQRAVVRRARIQIGSIAVAILVAMGALTTWALGSARRTADALLVANQATLVSASEAKAEAAAKADSDLARRKAEEQTKLALAAKAQAVRAQSEAQVAASQAEAALNGQKEQAVRADREAATAKQQTAIATANETRATHLAYVSAISSTAQNIENGSYGVAEQFIHDAGAFVKSERGVEWDYLNERLHPELVLLAGHTREVTSVAFSPDGKRIVTGSGDSTAKIWEAETGKELVTLRGHASFVSSVAFSPDGKRIVTGSFDGTARVWDAATAKELVTLRGHASFVSSVAFSPDGKRIVTGSFDRTARVWEAETGKELVTLRGQTGGVTSVAFSPDGKRIVTGSGDSTAKIWEAETGKELVTLRGHASFVSSVAFSPDGKRIVTGSFDGTARVWDAATGKELVTLRGHTLTVDSVAFSPDGKRIVTGSWDSTARLWRKPTPLQLKSMNSLDVDYADLAALSDLPLDRISESARSLAAKHPNWKAQISNYLNNAAFPAVDPDKKPATPEVAKQALEAATLAVECGDPQDGNLYDTLAAAQLACGNLDLALATERKAVRLSSADKTIAASTVATLKRYEALAAARKASPK